MPGGRPKVAGTCHSSPKDLWCKNCNNPKSKLKCSGPKQGDTASAAPEHGDTAADAAGLSSRRQRTQTTFFQSVDNLRDQSQARLASLDGPATKKSKVTHTIEGMVRQQDAKKELSGHLDIIVRTLLRGSVPNTTEFTACQQRIEQCVQPILQQYSNAVLEQRL